MGNCSVNNHPLNAALRDYICPMRLMNMSSQRIHLNSTQKLRNDRLPEHMQSASLQRREPFGKLSTPSILFTSRPVKSHVRRRVGQKNLSVGWYLLVNRWLSNNIELWVGESLYEMDEPEASSDEEYWKAPRAYFRAAWRKQMHCMTGRFHFNLTYWRTIDIPCSTSWCHESERFMLQVVYVGLTQGIALHDRPYLTKFFNFLLVKSARKIKETSECIRTYLLQCGISRKVWV